jgi:magnesium transporter
MAIFITFFEHTLSKYIIIASFVPTIVYLSGALGVQLQTVFIRDLAVLGNNIKIVKYFIRQMGISFFLSIIIGTFIFGFISLIWRNQLIAATIAIATILALILTGFNALLTTLILRKFKFDPTLGSGPIATVVSDLTSVVIYFGVVVILL